MTRVNLGIHPHELCDQHLIAEYRELPRVWGKQYKAQPPKQFGLNTGHVVWCAQYLVAMAERHVQITNEMLARGFKFQVKHIPTENWPALKISDTEISRARKILIPRLQERLIYMKSNPKPQHHPRWTLPGKIPEWARDVLG